MKKERFFLVNLLVLMVSVVSMAQVIPLYPGTVPNSKPADTPVPGERYFSGMYANVTSPTLEVFLPDTTVANGAAVVICPGGGYSVVVYQSEGINTAKEFVKHGVAAFVLKYRLPNDAIMMDKTIGPLQDAQQAIKMVRDNASKWGIDSNRVGIMGFSAGGHLATTAATHYTKPLIENLSNTNLRPDYLIAIYPVITMADSLTHAGSREALLGKSPSKKNVLDYSNERQVNAKTPPTFLTHAADDNTVDVDNSIFFFEQLRKYKVPVEMLIYPSGGHGFVLRQQGWMDPLFQWMKSSGFIK